MSRWSRDELQARVARACVTAPYEIPYGYLDDAPAPAALTYSVVTEASSDHVAVAEAIGDFAAEFVAETLASHVRAEEALDLQETYNHDPKVDEGTYAVILDDRDGLPACMVELGMAGGAAGCECHRCEAKRAPAPRDLLFDADPACNHDLQPQLAGGVKCTHCRGWFCY
jgi:hypothetical protein